MGAAAWRRPMFPCLFQVSFQCNDFCPLVSYLLSLWLSLREPHRACLTNGHPGVFQLLSGHFSPSLVCFSSFSFDCSPLTSMLSRRWKAKPPQVGRWEKEPEVAFQWDQGTSMYFSAREAALWLSQRWGRVLCMRQKCCQSSTAPSESYPTGPCAGGSRHR